MKEFLENNEFQQILKQTEKFANGKKRFSDIEDSQGNQYVDLVQEGGGVLGVALVGYTFVLEHSGIRFFSLAGTSAGAINTMMLAGLGPVEQAKSEKILEILANKNLFDLVDGDRAVRMLIKRIIRGESGIGWLIARNAIRFYNILTRKLGLNPGQDFRQWISAELGKSNISTMGDLTSLRGRIPVGFSHVNDGNIEDMLPRLAIIAADITTHSKIEFPRMNELFFEKPDEVSPAEVVRTSMSIPLFFEPVTWKNIPNAGKTREKAWIEHCRYFGPVPPEVTFVDGGLLSNFPINVFHRSDGGVPRMPTFGVRLSTYRQDYSEIKGLKSMTGAMISTMRQIHDYDFLRRNPDYSQLICHINADKDFNWLDFEISRDEQVKMFVLGAREALKFLESFDWEKYKETRRKLSKVTRH
ncbi:MAG: patatin-like phospholipase family protein [Bacteroidales bacterium]